MIGRNKEIVMKRQIFTALKVTGALLAGLATHAVDVPEAHAQEIQLTGPLAGAPAVRRLRLHRDGRFDIALHGTFTLLDEFRRTIIPGLRANYHFTDWLGVGVWGGYGFSYNTALSDELQQKAIDGRNCVDNPNSLPCRRTAVNLCRGKDCLAKNQLGRLQWIAAPQLTLVPFRGKFSLFGAAFMDADISLFLGPAVLGLQERGDCKLGECTNTNSFNLTSRVTVAPTFGVGFNFYPMDFLGFGAEFRGTPYTINPGGFDSAGNGDFPDDVINGDDRSFTFAPMLSVYVSVQLPTEPTVSD